MDDEPTYRRRHPVVGEDHLGSYHDVVDLEHHSLPTQCSEFLSMENNTILYFLDSVNASDKYFCAPELVYCFAYGVARFPGYVDRSRSIGTTRNTPHQPNGGRCWWLTVIECRR